MQGANGSPALQGVERTIATLGVLIASFMNVLDSTIAVVALPSIAGSLSATPSQGSWVLTIYGVCLAVVLPLSGWIARRFGQIRSFMVAVVIFTLTSWLCASATSFDQLLVFRALQGMSGGLLLPFSQSIVLRIYPPEEHGKALGFWGLTAAVAPVAGPLLGGFITDHLGWPWIFYINLPLGAFSVWACFTILRRFESETRKDPIDFVGLILLVVGVISVQLALDRGHELDWFASTQVRALVVVGVVCLISFLVWEMDIEHPIVDLSLFRSRSFALGSTMTALFYGAFFLSAVLYPLWMQTTLGYTASAAGLVMATTSVFPIISMPILGSRLRRLNPRNVVLLGCTLMFFALLLHAMVTIQVSSTYLTTVRFMIGVTMPFLWMPLTVLTLVGMPPDKMDTATGLSNFLRMLAASIATAIGITLWDDRTVVHRADLIQAVSNPTVERQQFFETVRQLGDDPESVWAAIEFMVFQQSRTMAQQDVFFACAAVIVGVALMSLMMPSRLPSSTTRTVTAVD